MMIRGSIVSNSLALLALLSPCISRAQCYDSQEGTPCNGLPNLCDIPVNEVLFGMVHNAMSSTEAGFVFYANNVNDPFNGALEAGYRGLKLDLCNCENQLVFCHGGRNVGCGIGQRDPVSTLLKLNDWLDSNPNEVVMVYLALNEAAEGPISLGDVQGILGSVPNKFSEKLYQHNPGGDWPTLKDMISENKRILLFYADGPDLSDSLPAGIHYFHSYGVETSDMHQNTNVLENKILEGCEVVDSSTTSTQDFLLLNNFVTGFGPFGQFIPSQSAARTVNTVEFAQPLLEACSMAHGTNVNILSVDFWKSGNIPELVRSHNEVLRAPGATPCPTNMPSSTPSDVPSMTPSVVPSQMPSLSPSKSPSALPSSLPSSGPSQIPSDAPSMVPSDVPSLVPSNVPSNVPSKSPSRRPSAAPSEAPTRLSVAAVQEQEKRNSGTDGVKEEEEEEEESAKSGKNFSTISLQVVLAMVAFAGLSWYFVQIDNIITPRIVIAISSSFSLESFSSSSDEEIPR